MPPPNTPLTHPATAPDISRYRQSNTRIDYVWRFESSTPGPTVMINALTHGNEPCGAHAIAGLLAQQVRPKCGALILSFANPAAFGHMDPNKPDQGRCIDEDLNRLWSDECLAGEPSSLERARARELLPIAASADYLLDLHSMSAPGPALTLCGMTARGRELARTLGLTPYIVADAGHQEGTRLRDFGGFRAPQGHKIALLIECGQHQAASSIAVANRAAARFLAHFDMIDATPGVLHDFPRTVEITHTVTAASPDYAYFGAMSSLVIVPKAGSVIARDGGAPVLTPYDECVLMMPSNKVSTGQTAVRLGRFVS